MPGAHGPSDDASRTVALNEIADLVRLLNSDEFHSLLSDAVKDSCDVRCGCHAGACSCMGNVQRIDELGMMPSELEKLKQRRLLELKQQLHDAETELYRHNDRLQ